MRGASTLSLAHHIAFGAGRKAGLFGRWGGGCLGSTMHEGRAAEGDDGGGEKGRFEMHLVFRGLND